jgi:hypothetical protein
MNIVPFVSKHLSSKVNPEIRKKAVEIVPPLLTNGKEVNRLFFPEDTVHLSAEKAYLEKERSKNKLTATGCIGLTAIALVLNLSGLVNVPKWIPSITAPLAAVLGGMAFNTNRKLKTLEKSIEGCHFSVEDPHRNTVVLNQLPRVFVRPEKASLEYADLTLADFQKAARDDNKHSALVQGSIQDGYYFPAGTDLTRYPITLKAGESRTYSIDGYGEITLQPGEKADAFIWEWIKTLGSENTKATREQSIPLLKNPVISSYQFDYGAEESAKFDQALENSFQRRVQKKS